MPIEHIISGSVITENEPLPVLIVGTTPIVSDPPSGMCKISNIYWDPELERVVVVHNDTPEE